MYSLFRIHRMGADINSRASFALPMLNFPESINQNINCNENNSSYNNSYVCNANTNQMNNIAEVMDLLSKIDSEIQNIYNGNNLKIRKHALTYDCQYIFAGEIFTDVYTGRDLLCQGIRERWFSDHDSGDAFENKNFSEKDIYIRSGQFASFIKTHLFDTKNLVEKKYIEANTFSKSYKLGFRLQPLKDNKRSINYIKFNEGFELLKKALNGTAMTPASTPMTSPRPNATPMTSPRAVLPSSISSPRSTVTVPLTPPRAMLSNPISPRSIIPQSPPRTMMLPASMHSPRSCVSTQKYLLGNNHPPTALSLLQPHQSMSMSQAERSTDNMSQSPSPSVMRLEKLKRKLSVLQNDLEDVQANKFSMDHSDVEVGVELQVDQAVSRLQSCLAEVQKMIEY